jgi:hypothetical protein
MQKKKDKNKKWPIRERIKNQQPIETVQWPMYYSHMQHMWITTPTTFIFESYSSGIGSKRPQLNSQHKK